MTTLSHFLSKKNDNKHLTAIIEGIATAGIAIRGDIHINATKKNQEENATGDTQSALDLITDTIVRDVLEETNCVATAASEERESCYHFDSSKASYFVAYDPYDGGSVGDANISFGSIFGIWSKDPLHSPVGKDLVASCYIIYGPRVTFVLSIKGEGSHLFELGNDNIFYLVSSNLQISKEAHHFAPGNLRTSMTHIKYRKVLDRWLNNAYTLRYTGAFVTDINHILLKGNGIFTYPAEEKYPNGRLRLLYECAPLAMITEEAGGKGSTEHGTAILDEIIDDHHQRSTVVIGSSSEVLAVTKILQ